MTYLHVFFRLTRIPGVLQKLSHISHDWFFIWIHNVNIYKSQYTIYIIMQPSRPDHIITCYTAVIKTHYHKHVYFAAAQLTYHWQKLICNEPFFPWEYFNITWLTNEKVSPMNRKASYPFFCILFLHLLPIQTKYSWCYQIKNLRFEHYSKDQCSTSNLSTVLLFPVFQINTYRIILISLLITKIKKKTGHLPSGSRSRGIFSSSSAILKASFRFSLLLLAFAFSKSTRPGRKVWMMAKKGSPLRQLDLKSVTLIEPCLSQKLLETKSYSLFPQMS